MPRPSRALIATAAALFAALLPTAARAATVTYSFTGVTNQGEDLDHHLFATYPVGTPFSGTLTVNLDAVDTLPDPNYGNFENAVIAATMTLGPDAMDTSWNNRSDSTLLRFEYYPVSNQTFLDIDFHAVRLSLDLSGLGLTDATAIPTNLNLDAATLAARFTSGQFQRDKYDYVAGPLTSFTATLNPTVPLPASAFAALPLLTLTATRRRRV